MIFNPVRKEPRFYKGDSQISLRTSWPTPWRFIPRWLPRPPKQPFLEALALQQFIALPSFLLPTHSKPHKLICHEQEHLNKRAPFLGCWKLIKAGMAGQVYYSMLYHLFRHSVGFFFVAILNTEFLMERYSMAIVKPWSPITVMEHTFNSVSVIGHYVSHKILSHFTDELLIDSMAMIRWDPSWSCSSESHKFFVLL